MGAMDGADRCSDHVCAFQPPDRPNSGRPTCNRDPIEGQIFCWLHASYVWLRGEVG